MAIVSDRLDQIATALTELGGGDPTDIRRALREYDVRDIIAVLANNLAGGDGGPEPGAVRLLDLGLITAADVAAGAVTLYTPAADEIIGPVLLGDWDITDSIALVVTFGDQHAPPKQALAFVADEAGSSYDWIGLTATQSASSPLSDPFTDTFISTLVSGQPIVVGATQTLGIGNGAAIPWTANTGFDDTLGVPCVIGAGHVWTGTSGTTDVSEPDFAGNIGGTVTDNDITWTDVGALPSTGQMHVYAYSATPVVP